MPSKYGRVNLVSSVASVPQGFSVQNSWMSVFRLWSVFARAMTPRGAGSGKVSESSFGTPFRSYSGAPVELTFDLGLHRVKPRLDGERRTFGLYDVQDVARDRRALRSLLRGTRYDRVEVLYDTLPRSVARAAGLVIAAFLRTRRFELRGDGQRRPVGRLELLVRGAA